MKVLVITSVFPNRKQPTLGVFVRERMFHVAKLCKIKVIAPVPCFPLARLIKKDYRPIVPRKEIQNGIEVFHPRFFNIPRFFKFLDSFLFVLSIFRTVVKVKKNLDFDVIDAHFVYPDGIAAVLIGKILRKSVVITLRGPRNTSPSSLLRKMQIGYALNNAQKVFAVSDSLKELALQYGIPATKVKVIPNGVDITKFKQKDKAEMRKKLNLPLHKRIIISVGGIVERKGFHRVINVLPQIIRTMPNILYVILGGPSVEGDFSQYLKRQVNNLQLTEYVIFAGPKPHKEVCDWLNAADVFCLATKAEGWANVFFEALACGKPVVTTNVGGNSEVINSKDYGMLVDLDDQEILANALIEALKRKWDQEKMVKYANDNTWEKVAENVYQEFKIVLNQPKTVSS